MEWKKGAAGFPKPSMDSHKTTIVYSASDPSGGMRKATRKRDKAPFLRARSCHHTFKGLSHSRVAVFLVLGITPLASAQPQLEVQLAPAAHIYDEAAPEGEMFVRHPWAIRDQQLERDKASQMEEVPSPVRNIITRDGVEFFVSAAKPVVPVGTEVGVYIGVFSASLTVPEVRVEDWMAEGNLPPPHNPVRTWTLFSSQYPDGRVEPDELGDVCVGEAFRAEFCARVTTCFNAFAEESGGGKWRVAAQMPFASNYRIEVYLSDPNPECRTYQSGALATKKGEFVWWAPPVAEHAVQSRSGVARYAAFTRFRLLHVNKVSWWWSYQAQIQPVSSWTEMMGAAVDAASRSLASTALEHKLFKMPDTDPHGLWLEFGVGSGKTTAYISLRMQSMFGPGVKLHGFDSFQGLPTSWAHTKLQTGTFSMGGQIPEHLNDKTNVQIHVGLFGETLPELDVYGAMPVAFVHVDVDLYESAVEVLVFDELVNYVGFELSGEYRAWEYVASAYQIEWEYAGIFWQQAVPIFIAERGRAC